MARRTLGSLLIAPMIAIGAMSAAATNSGCAGVNSFIPNWTAPVASADLDGFGTEEALISSGNSLFALDGRTGGTKWVLARDAQEYIAHTVLTSTDGVPASGVMLVVEPSGCQSLLSVVIDGTSGASATRSLGSVISPGETKSNVFAKSGADFTGDAVEDLLVEVKSYTDTRLVHESRQFTYEGRDINPGVKTSGFALIVDGRSGLVAKRIDKELSAGPGPLSTYFKISDANAVATITQSTTTGDAYQSRVRAFSRIGELWSVQISTLSLERNAFALSNGPAFVTQDTFGPLQDDGVVTGIPRSNKLTALDGDTGVVLWEREWTQPLQPWFWPVEGDVVVDDYLGKTLTRFRGNDGAELWRISYLDAVRPRYELPPVMDQDGDGFTDFLSPDGVPAPTLYSGRSGTPTPRPAYAAGLREARGPLPVIDINNDGADELIGFLSAGPSEEGVPEGVIAVAFDGRTGNILWLSPTVTAGPEPIFAASGYFRDTSHRDVIIYRIGRQALLLDGRTGELIWDYLI